MKIVGRLIAIILWAWIYEVVADKITFPLLWGNVLIIALISISDFICDYRREKSTKKE